jgi:hypothetical protein
MVLNVDALGEGTFRTNSVVAAFAGLIVTRNPRCGMTIVVSRRKGMIFSTLLVKTYLTVGTSQILLDE